MRSFLGVCAILGAAFAFGACGGNVVVDGPPGGGGAGGQGGFGANGQGGFGGGTVPTFCQSFCSQAAPYDCGIDPSTCVADCTGAFDQSPEACKEPFYEYLQCFLASLPEAGCDPTNSCQQEILAYSECFGTGTGGSGGGPGTCEEYGCSFGDDGSCFCEGFCGEQYQAVECAPQGGTFACDCLLNGNLVGSCSEPAGSCDIEFGCCSAYFAQEG